MQTKLTLRIDNNLIKKVKLYSHNQGKSVSQLVTDYFVKLGLKTDDAEVNLPPITRHLLGVLKKAPKISQADYRNYLEDKYL